MNLKELFLKIGINLEVRNFVVGYRQKNGRSANQVRQMIANGVKCADAEIVAEIKKTLPEGSRVCGIFEVYGNMELKELQRLAGSPELLNYKVAPIYLDEELATEYVREILNGDFS